MLIKEKLNKIVKMFGIGSLCLFLLGCSEESFMIQTNGETFLEDIIEQETIEKETLENVEVGKVALESTTGIQSEDGEALRETDGNGWEAAKSLESLDDKTEIAVHICGAVHQPGVYVFQGKYRIYDGIQKAGGFTKEAEENYLNLALYLEDGMKIEVPTKEEVKSWREKDGITATGISYKDDDGVAWGKSKNDGRVNLNTADVTLLCTLSGIGKSRAESIIAYREEYGAFQTIEDIMKVPGIKEAAYKKIKDYVKVAE